MNQGNFRLVCFVLFILILTAFFGCSSDKAFKSGMTYKCDGGKIFVVELYDKVDIAILKIEEKRYVLPRVPSASGTKYSEGNVTLWLEGEKASIEIDGRSEFKNCSIKPK